MASLLLLIILCLGGSGFVSGHTLNDSLTLMEEMLSGYDRRHRPVENQSSPIQVNVSFDIIALQDFDEVDEKFSVAALMYLVWADEKITWDPESYGGITTQLYQLKDVWYPILVLGNPYESAHDVGAKWMTVRYHFDGTAFFAPGAIFKATCQVDVTYYPFDTQVCYLIFTPWGYRLEEMTLLSTRNYVLQTYYSENGEWTIVKTYASVDANFFTLEFTLKRKPLFLTVNVLLPIIFMACINLFTFMLPEESGEKISFSITCLLAIAVFLTLVSDNLPKRSQPMSIMCYYLMIILIISVLICLAAILNLKIYFTDISMPVPPFCEKLVHIMTCERKTKLTKKSRDRVRIPASENNLDDRGSRHESLLEETQQRRDNTPISWKEVSHSVNRLCIISFSVVIFVVTVAFMSLITCNGLNTAMY